MANESPQSFQTTMPEYPDVSYQTWKSKYGSQAGRLTDALTAWFNGDPNYETWRQNNLDDYNSKVSAYNAWASSPLGMRTQNEQAGYNASYSSGATSQGSPLSYQDVNPGNGFAEMAQGISGIFSFAQAIQGMKMLSEQIRGQQIKNGVTLQDLKSKEINNRYLDSLLSGKVTGMNFNNDKLQYDIEALFYPRWSKYPELWKGGAFSPYGRGTYDLRDADLSFGYQRAFNDIQAIRSATRLRDQQTEIAKLDQKAKEFYNTNLLELQKQILDGQLKLINGQVDFQPIEQELRKKAVNWGIGLQATNTVINGIKTALTFIPGVGGMPGLGGNSWTPQFNSGNTWSPGVDITSGAFYGLP